MLFAVAVALVGLVAWLVPGSLCWVGRPPADVRTDYFVFPIVTCLLISAVGMIVSSVLAHLLR